MDCLTREPEGAFPSERRQQAAALKADLDQAVERVLLYLRCLDLSEDPDALRLLNLAVREAERRLLASARGDPAAIMLEELQRLLPADATRMGQDTTPLLSPVPVPTPPPSPLRMTEQRLDYCEPIRALQEQIVALVELVLPSLRRYGQ
jgi:hypothetical protein